MSEEGLEGGEEGLEGGETHVNPKPEWCDDRFYDAKTGDVRYEDIHKSWTHANETLSGKRLAPDAYELGISKEFDKEMLEGIDGEHPVIKSMMDIARKSDMTQDNFNEVLNLFIGTDIAELEEAERFKEREMASLGEHGTRRLNDIHGFLDANLEKEHSAGIKDVLNTAASIEAIEKLIAGTKAPSLNIDSELTGEQVASHDELRKRQFAKDDFGNRLFSTNPAYRKQWQEDAAAAGFKA